MGFTAEGIGTFFTELFGGAAAAEGGTAALGGIEAAGLGAVEGTAAGEAFAAGAAGAGAGAAGFGEAGTAGLASTGLQAALQAAASGGGSFSIPAGISQGLNIASGLYGLDTARKVRNRSDPFSSYRPGYAARLQELEANPNLISTVPGYQAGLQAVQRKSAAGGYTGSGNEQAALAQFGGGFYNQELARLAGLAGAGAPPGNGSALYADLLSRSLATLGYGVAPSIRKPGGP